MRLQHQCSNRPSEFRDDPRFKFIMQHAAEADELDV
ncbi:hypothetical protein GGP86_000319 [Salinibacter ruber]|nr:hypothetical protein [Salinibacter ruber]